MYEDVWPLGSTNTILNVCPQGERFVVERFGKLLDIKESGWFLGKLSLGRVDLCFSLSHIDVVSRLVMTCLPYAPIFLSYYPVPRASHPLRGPHRLPHRHA